MIAANAQPSAKTAVPISNNSMRGLSGRQRAERPSPCRSPSSTPGVRIHRRRYGRPHGHGRMRSGIHAERADQEQHEKDCPEVGAFPDIAKAATKPPGARTARRLWRSSPWRRNVSEQSTPPNDRAFRQEGPNPFRRPRSAGPRGRDPPHARGVERGGVERHRVGQVGFAHQIRNECLPRGASNAAAQPWRKANTYTCQSWTTPVTVSSPSVSAQRPIAACVAIKSLRRSKKSAAKPLKGSISICGPNCSAITRPTALALLWVSWSAPANPGDALHPRPHVGQRPPRTPTADNYSWPAKRNVPAGRKRRAIAASLPLAGCSPSRRQASGADGDQNDGDAQQHPARMTAARAHRLPSTPSR